MFIRDLDFAAKAARVLNLRQRVFDEDPLADNECMIPSDEKTSIQARCRPALPPGLSRTMCVSHEYDRGGSVSYLAAYDVHHAQAFGHCAAKTGIAPFMPRGGEVMSSELYASAGRVFFGWSTMDPRTAAKPPPTGFPNAVMVHTPVHASWLNQVEIYYSLVQRKVVSPNDFTSLDQVEDRLTVFARRYEQAAALRMEVHPGRPRGPDGPDRAQRAV